MLDDPFENGCSLARPLNEASRLCLGLSRTQRAVQVFRRKEDLELLREEPVIIASEFGFLFHFQEVTEKVFLNALHW